MKKNIYYNKLKKYSLAEAIGTVTGFIIKMSIIIFVLIKLSLLVNTICYQLIPATCSYLNNHQIDNISELPPAFIVEDN